MSIKRLNNNHDSKGNSDNFIKNDLKKIKSIPTYSCNDIEDQFLSSEIMLSLSEI